jgi:hypothetical protein
VPQILFHVKRRRQTRDAPTRFVVKNLKVITKEVEVAVTIVKPKAKVIDKVVASQIVSPETVDEYANLKAKLDKKNEKIAPLAKEVASLEKGILGAVDEVVDPGTPLNLTGYENELVIGPKGQKVAISDIEGILDIMGMETFLKLCTVSTANLKKYLTPEQVEAVTKTSYAIKRRMKVEAI